MEAEEKARLAKLEEERKKADELRKQQDVAQKAKDDQAVKDKQDAVKAIEEEIKKQKEDSDNINFLYKIFSESVHLTLDVIGGAGGVVAPGFADIADLVNCAYYAVEGRKAEALTSCIGAIPLAGDGAAVAKLVQWAKKFGSWGEKAAEFIKKLVTRLPKTCPRPNSFPAGTQVLMGDGSRKPIEAISVGDSVLATDPVTGQTAPRAVDAVVYTPDDRDFTDLDILGDNGSGSLTATDHHPFWAEDRHGWVDAAGLSVEDLLRTPSGSTAKIVGVQHRKILQGAYNLTVRDLHTYYVLAGPTPVLVHNIDCFDPLDLATSFELPVFEKTTYGVAQFNGGSPFKMWSGDRVNSMDLMRKVSDKLREAGILKGESSISGQADHVEQKLAAMMMDDASIVEAEVVINNPNGPCITDPYLGCDAVLNLLVGDKSFKVHWPDGKGGFKDQAFGTGRAKRR
ncbi:polymorphic toxin-type HINT domain-containing protein [Kitasatospora sp. NPDC056181]|uniref:polymorphic toxin-type HINT domain-containing protein n=1 Tax=Kitasatospora sp. NPDC056181 TaxID=3345737 RepID=UPI0035E16A85